MKYQLKKRELNRYKAKESEQFPEKNRKEKEKIKFSSNSKKILDSMIDYK